MFFIQSSVHLIYCIWLREIYTIPSASDSSQLCCDSPLLDPLKSACKSLTGFIRQLFLLVVLYNDFFMNLNHIAHVLSVSRNEYEECLYESCWTSLQLRRVLPTVAVWDHTQRCLKSRVWVYNVFVYSITSTLHGIALFKTATRRSLAPNLYLHDFLYYL